MHVKRKAQFWLFGERECCSAGKKDAPLRCTLCVVLWFGFIQHCALFYAIFSAA